jgi:hypothetical protein
MQGKVLYTQFYILQDVHLISSYFSLIEEMKWIFFKLLLIDSFFLYKIKGENSTKYFLIYIHLDYWSENFDMF